MKEKKYGLQGHTLGQLSAKCACGVPTDSVRSGDVVIDLVDHVAVLEAANAALRREIKRLRTWQVGLVEMEKERDSAVTRADAAEAALVEVRGELEELKRPTLEQTMNSILDRRPELMDWARHCDKLAILNRAEPEKGENK